MSEKRIITPLETVEDVQLDQSLRPTRLADYIGQLTVKENVSVLIESTKLRGGTADHVVLYGPPGLGKTTLAQIIATELEVPFKATSGPALERTGDLVSLLSTLTPQSVLFIDEIHRIRRPLEEILYPAMEDRHIDITMGKGPGARSIQLPLPPFTLIGATTRLGSLSGPLRDRFGTVLHLEYYTDEELCTILERTAQRLSLKTEKAALETIARRSRRTPRLANRLLRRAADYALARHDTPTVTVAAANDALRLLQIDDRGLDQLDRQYLRVLLNHQRPVGLSTLAAALHEERETIEDVIEPFLLREGLIYRTPQGRLAAPQALDHLNGQTLF